MSWIDGLLGFAVLTGPLWLILIIVPAALMITLLITTRMEPGRRRTAARAGLFVIFLILPFGDEIAGRAYHGYLCATKAGVKVYQTVELPAEYWDAEGKAKFYKNFDSLLGRHYIAKYEIDEYSLFFHIDRIGYVISKKQDDQILGEVVDFRFWGGLIGRKLSSTKSAISCIDYSNSENRLIDRIFVMEIQGHNKEML